LSADRARFAAAMRCCSTSSRPFAIMDARPAILKIGCVDCERMFDTERQFWCTSRITS
jgi:hypothetical protein